MSADTLCCRMLLKPAHAEVRTAFPEIRNAARGVAFRAAFHAAARKVSSGDPVWLSRNDMPLAAHLKENECRRRCSADSSFGPALVATQAAKRRIASAAAVGFLALGSKSPHLGKGACQYSARGGAYCKVFGMTAIGGVWLYAVLFCFGVDAADQGCGPPQVVQRAYPTRAACEQASADILRKLPRAYATCLH